MSCCGTKYRVKKTIINSQIKQQLPKLQVKQDDVIRIPIEERKLFRCNFKLSKIIKPEHMIVATIDYAHINTQYKYQQFSKPLERMMIRQQSPIRQDKVQFQLRQKEIIRSGGVEIVKSDSDKREVGEEGIDLKVIDQFKKENDKIKQKGLQQKEWEMMVI